MKFSSVVLWGLAVFSASASAGGRCGCGKNKEKQGNKVGGNLDQPANAAIKGKKGDLKGVPSVLPTSPSKKMQGAQSGAGGAQSGAPDLKQIIPGGLSTASKAATGTSSPAPSTATGGSPVPSASPKTTEIITSEPIEITTKPTGASTTIPAVSLGTGDLFFGMDPSLFSSTHVKPIVPPPISTTIPKNEKPQFQAEINKLQKDLNTAKNSFAQLKGKCEKEVNQITEHHEKAIAAVTAYNTAINEKKLNDAEIQKLKNDASDKISAFLSKYDAASDKLTKAQSELPNILNKVNAKIKELSNSIKDFPEDLKKSAKKLSDERKTLASDIGKFSGLIINQLKEIQKNKNEIEAFKPTFETPTPSKKPELSAIHKNVSATLPSLKTPANVPAAGVPQGATSTVTNFGKEALSTVANFGKGAATGAFNVGKSFFGAAANLISQAGAAAKGPVKTVAAKAGDAASKLIFGLTPAQKLAEEQKKRHARFAAIPKAVTVEHYNQLVQILAEALLSDFNLSDLSIRLHQRDQDIQKMIADVKPLNVLSPQQQQQFEEIEKYVHSISAFVAYANNNAFATYAFTSNLILRNFYLPKFAEKTLNDLNSQAPKNTQNIKLCENALNVLKDAQKLNESFFKFDALFQNASSPGKTLSKQEHQNLAKALDDFLSQQIDQLAQMLSEAQLINVDLKVFKQRLEAQKNYFSNILKFFQKLNANSNETKKINEHFQLLETLEKWVNLAAINNQPSFELHQYLNLALEKKAKLIDEERKKQSPSQQTLDSLLKEKDELKSVIDFVSAAKEFNEHIVEMRNLVVSEAAAQQEQKLQKFLQDQFEELKSLLANVNQTQKVSQQLAFFFYQVDQELLKPSNLNLPIIAQELKKRKEFLEDLFSLIQIAPPNNFTLGKLLEYVEQQLKQVEAQQPAIHFSKDQKEEEIRRLKNVLSLLQEAKNLQQPPQPLPQQPQQNQLNVPSSAKIYPAHQQVVPPQKPPHQQVQFVQQSVPIPVSNTSSSSSSSKKQAQKAAQAVQNVAHKALQGGKKAAGKVTKLFPQTPVNQP